MSANDQLQQFFTREKANEGIEFKLALPDGTPTEHWLRIRGIDSDAFRRAEAESRRLMLEIASKGDKDAAEAASNSAREQLLASLVAGWSFSEPFTKENVLKLLVDAPQIADQIDRIASNRKRFFGNGLNSFTPAHAQSSSSPSQ